MAAIAGMRINSFDLDWLIGLGRYGLLSTEQAADFYVNYKLNSVQKRLRLLTQNGLTRMTKLSVWFAGEKQNSKGGRVPTLHALTDEGARLIEMQTGVYPERILRSDPSPGTFWHRQQIVRVMRAIDLACDAVEVDRPEWIMEQDAWTNANPKLPPNQRRMLYHDLGHGLICQPDLACRFRIGKTELALFWEVDLSTEGKKQLRKAAKTDSYVALFNQRAYQCYWPDLNTNRNHVIWVAPTRKRIATLREVMQSHPIGPACRFLSATDIKDPNKLLVTPVWQTISGESRPMFQPR